MVAIRRRAHREDHPGPATRHVSASRHATDDDALDGTLASPVDRASRGAALARGDVVGRYVVLSTLGAGAMGVVYAAHDPELDRKVALKLLSPGAARDRAASSIEARTRLVREAQALAKLSHPNVIAVHDVGEHDGGVWLAMEFVEGVTLTEWLARRRGWREVLEVLRAAGRGLAAAHEAKLLHRDFKPDNVMVGRDGRTRVMDLGLARVIEGADEETLELSVSDALGDDARADSAALTTTVTRAGALLGTPSYMSPEQFKGQGADTRSDVFSFCVTLWEALYGERP
ncbi:MAG: serine/threonine protein kinase, partial [Myxococcales bacterium]|nr:serine/threonine protein kinase [Myxococcales bacterium]